VSRRTRRVAFDADAARELRKLGPGPQRLILTYLRTRIATAEDPRRFGRALTADLKGFGVIGSATIASSPRSRSTGWSCWW
jgi:mRNA-degrading endonuclease RelE of RelBE toxin-antitoxin system